MRTKLIYLSILLLSMSLSSCYKQQEEATLQDYDITLTYYDTDFNFKAYNTFAIRDSVVLISDYLTPKQQKEFYTKGTSDNIIAKINSELIALGYTKTETNEEADFIINPTVTLMEQTDYYYSPGWWWGYPGYWGGYWKGTDYYYYPYYPYYGYSYSYTYQTGTLIIEMFNGDSYRAYIDWMEENGPDGDHSDAPAVELNWTAHVEGIAGSDAEYNKDRAKIGIEEAFNQSPYLKK